MADPFPPKTIMGTALDQIQRVLADVPPDKKFAFVTTYDGSTIRAGAATRIQTDKGWDWQFGGQGQFEADARKLTGFVYVKVEAE